MSVIFDGIEEDDEPLECLVDFMKFMFGESSFRLYIV